MGPSTGTGEGNGGAINNSSTAAISWSTFTGNEALGRTTNGGAISAGENELIALPTMSISNCVFTGNEAIGANGADDFTNFEGGQALGGAVASATPLSVSASTFTNNLALGGDKGNNLYAGVVGGLTVGTAYGGGLVEFFSPLTITSSTFAGNEAIGGNSALGIGGGSVGGGVCLFGSPLATFTSVKFVGNQAIGGAGGPGYTGGSGFGGGLYNGVDSTLVVTDGLFSANLAEGGAGGSGAAARSEPAVPSRTAAASEHSK